MPAAPAMLCAAHDELDALYAFLTAMVAAAALTPFVARLAARLGAVNQPRDRGLSDEPTPLLGGLAIFAGVFLAGAIWLPAARRRGRSWPAPR